METQNEQQNSTPDLHFGGGGGMVAVAGALSGVAIALGGPAILLSLGQSLGPAVLTTLVVIALAGGALVALTSSFFGLVIPRHMRGGPWMDPERWRRFAREGRRWQREHRRWHGHGGGYEEDEADEDEEAAPRRKPRGARRP